jgi:HK97 family phage major capsid protein
MESKRRSTDHACLQESSMPRSRPRDPVVVAAEIDAAMAKRERLRLEMAEYWEVVRARSDEVLNDPDATLEDMQNVPSRGEQSHLERLQRGVEKAGDLYDALVAEQQEIIRSESDREAIRSRVLNSPYRESGDGATALARSHSGISGILQSRKAPTMTSRSGMNPWDWNGQFPTSGEILRSNALHAIDLAYDDGDGEEKPKLDEKALQRVANLISRGGVRGDRAAMYAHAYSNPDYESGFAKFVEYPDSFRELLTPEETRAWSASVIASNELGISRAALSVSGAAAAIPMTLDPAIILTNSGIVDPLRSISTIKTISTDDWNGVVSAGVDFEWLAESTEAADKTPTLSAVTITPKKFAAWVFGSYEALADSNFQTEIGRLLADGRDRNMGAAFATGNTGATKPRGVVAAVAAVTASLVSSATTTAFVAGDVYRVSDALRPRDAVVASWICNKTIMSKIRQFDTSGGSAFWASMGMGVPSQLLGQPIYQASTMTSVITTSANVLLAGNFAEFYIVDRLGSTLIYQPMVLGSNRRPSGEAGWFMYGRVGSDVVDPDAFRLLTLTTSPAFTALG